MSFRRTPSGLQNLHLFHGVDFVVFCEGGHVSNMNEAISIDSDIDVIDLFFWGKLFTYFAPSIKIHVKPSGSKTILKDIYKDCIHSGVEKILVCMDRDLDDFNGEYLEASFLIYTFGYSWENDVINRDTLEGFFFSLVSRNQASEIQFDQVLKDLMNFVSQCKIYCEYEISLCKKPNSSMLFCRDKPMKSLRDKNSNYELNVEYLKDALSRRGYKTGPRRIKRLNIEEAHRYLFGHLLANYIYHRINNISGSKAIKQTKESFFRLLVDRLITSIQSGKCNPQKSYYETTIGRAVAKPV